MERVAPATRTAGRMGRGSVLGCELQVNRYMLSPPVIMITPHGTQRARRVSEHDRLGRREGARLSGGDPPPRQAAPTAGLPTETAPARGGVAPLLAPPVSPDSPAGPAAFPRAHSRRCPSLACPKAARYNCPFPPEVPKTIGQAMFDYRRLLLAGALIALALSGPHRPPLRPGHPPLRPDRARRAGPRRHRQSLVPRRHRGRRRAHRRAGRPRRSHRRPRDRRDRPLRVARVHRHPLPRRQQRRGRVGAGRSATTPPTARRRPTSCRRG